MTTRVLYPVGYATTYVTMSQLKALHLNHMHPAFAERLFPWIEAQGGRVGIGSGIRLVQPVKPGFAPAGKSFHQRQTFASGLNAYAAVDLVAPDGPDGNHDHDGVTWAMVPAQGSDEAALWGVHCNVGTPGVKGSEPWHMQPVELDGFDTWQAAGCPDPVSGWCIPEEDEVTDDDIERIAKRAAELVWQQKVTNQIAHEDQPAGQLLGWAHLEAYNAAHPAPE